MFVNFTTKSSKNFVLNNCDICSNSKHIFSFDFYFDNETHRDMFTRMFFKENLNFDVYSKSIHICLNKKDLEILEII